MPQSPRLMPVRGAGEAGAQRPFLDTRNFAIETGALFSNICVLLFGCTFYISAVHADEAYGYNFYFEPITFMFIVGTQSAFAWIVFKDCRDVSGAASAKARPARPAGARRKGGPPQMPLRGEAGWPTAPLADAAGAEVAGSLGGQRATRKRPPFRTPGADLSFKISICEDEVGCAGHGSRKTSGVKSRAGQAEVLKTFIREDAEKVGSVEYGGVDYAGWRCGMSASWRMSRLMQNWGWLTFSQKRLRQELEQEQDNLPLPLTELNLDATLKGTKINQWVKEMLDDGEMDEGEKMTVMAYYYTDFFIKDFVSDTSEYSYFSGTL
eukprot:gene28419-35221_t